MHRRVIGNSACTSLCLSVESIDIAQCTVGHR